MNRILLNAMEKLNTAFPKYNWTFYEHPDSGEEMYKWPGDPGEDVMICVHKGHGIHEDYHKQDFFFINYAYKGGYKALSGTADHEIFVPEEGCYIGQPFAGYGLRGHYEEEIIIIGILIQKDVFFKTFFPSISANQKLFHFFLDPRIDSHSSEHLQISFKNESFIKELFNRMVLEYANPHEDTQNILKSLILTLLLYIVRACAEETEVHPDEKLADQLIRYMNEHTDTVSLQELSNVFSYHPNYIAKILKDETKHTFYEGLLDIRMTRAKILLEETNLTIEEIAYTLGYSNSSNFYKTFKKFYKMSPREFIDQVPF